MRSPTIHNSREPDDILMDVMFGKEIRFSKRVENLEDDTGRLEDRIEEVVVALQAIANIAERRMTALETSNTDLQARCDGLEHENAHLRAELGGRVREDQTTGEWMAGLFDAIQTGYEQEQLTVRNIVKIKERLDALEKAKSKVP